MKNSFQFLILAPLFIAAALIGCAQGNCRQVAAAEAKAKGETGPTETPATASSSQDRIQIFKYDGSQQCGSGKPISVSDMQEQQLKGIQVYNSSNKMDGLMHMQMCGAPTGKANVYEIDKHQLTDAVKQGFKQWLWN